MGLPQVLGCRYMRDSKSVPDPTRGARTGLGTARIPASASIASNEGA